MKFTTLTLTLVLTATSSAAALWPIPKSYSHGNDTVWLSPAVNVEFAGYAVCWIWGGGGGGLQCPPPRPRRPLLLLVDT